MNWKSKKYKIIYIKKNYQIYFILLFAISLLINIYTIYEYWAYFPEIDSIVKMNGYEFDGYSEYEREKILDIMSEVKQEYLKDINKIRFSKESVIQGDMRFVGKYDPPSKSIFVVTENQLCRTLEILCHELLHHQKMKHGNILDDYESKLVCFRDDFVSSLRC